MGRWSGALVATVLLGAGVAALPGTTGPAAAAAVDPAVLGTSGDTAAGSCWEVKQARPSAADGSYWLLTPAMTEPARFYCDMTTDGGGWVLVGKGRDAWTSDYEGKGSSSDLLSPVTSPMSSATAQLASDRVDQLLDGGRVDALTDGVRLRRATDVAGTGWQEVRVRFASRSRWAWTFGAEWPLAGYSFDGTARTGGTAPSFGIDSAYRRVVNTTDAAKNYRVGFGYGSLVVGSTSATSYLYSPAGRGGAIPYTQVYLRPKVTSTDAGFGAVPDGGTPAVARPRVVRSTALASPWGVSGTAGSAAEEGNVEVQAFTQSGDRMYVGGNFRYVQQDGNGTGQVEQPFLAAFDARTGEWVRSFRPVLNEQVRALGTLPDGQVVAGGDFTTANGAPATAVVALDPETGETSTSWTSRLENRVSGAALRVNTIDVAAPYVYIGGNLTHFLGGTRTASPVYMRMLGRVSATDGTPSTGWNPNLNGTVRSVDASADLSRVYAAGFFTTSNGAPAKNAAAILNAPGAPLAGAAWTPTWSAATSYQQAIQEVGERVWVGGSEHNLFQFSTGTFQRLGGDIFKSHGDVQAVTADRGVVYAGCHCNQYGYTGAYTWPTLGPGWTQADAIGWFGAWDASTGERVPGFVPTFGMRLNQGIWALEADSNGTVWAGGDIATVRTNGQMARWSGGFARFPLADSEAPPAPSGLRVTAETEDTVTLSWGRVSDTGGGVRYQVLRDDRPIGATSDNTTSLTVPQGGANRFFVRAVDGAGNVSASTPVLVPGGNTAPTSSFTASVSGLTAGFDAAGSGDADGTVTSYSWSFGDGSTGTGQQVEHTYAEPGDYAVTLTVEDDRGATAAATRTVTAQAEDAEPADAVVVENGADWRWRYAAGAPAPGWNTSAFDASAWPLGSAVLGFGSAVATDIDTFAATSDRPRTAHFTRAFQVPDAARAVRLVLRAVADDGVVLYVNGTEVARSNMPTGTVTHLTFASSARRSSAAAASPVVVEVPASLLVTGTNVVSAETHLNHRGTADVGFDLQATLTARP